jgi:hypothetical protein
MSTVAIAETKPSQPPAPVAPDVAISLRVPFEVIAQTVTQSHPPKRPNRSAPIRDDVQDGLDAIDEIQQPYCLSSEEAAQLKSAHARKSARES